MRKSFFDSQIIAFELIFNFSLLGKGYMSPEANVLTSSPETSHANKRDFFQLKCVETYQ